MSTICLSDVAQLGLIWDGWLEAAPGACKSMRGRHLRRCRAARLGPGPLSLPRGACVWGVWFLATVLSVNGCVPGWPSPSPFLFSRVPMAPGSRLYILTCHYNRSGLFWMVGAELRAVYRAWPSEHLRPSPLSYHSRCGPKMRHR